MEELQSTLFEKKNRSAFHVPAIISITTKKYIYVLSICKSKNSTGKECEKWD
jgi:hypothetical protein